MALRFPDRVGMGGLPASPMHIQHITCCKVGNLGRVSEREVSMGRAMVVSFGGFFKEV